MCFLLFVGRGSGFTKRLEGKTPKLLNPKSLWKPSEQPAQALENSPGLKKAQIQNLKTESQGFGGNTHQARCCVGLRSEARLCFKAQVSQSFGFIRLKEFSDFGPRDFFGLGSDGLVGFGICKV